MANRYINDFTPSVKAYYQDLKKINVLTEDKEKELICKAKKNNIQAKNLLLVSNLKFVFNVAKKYKGMGVAMEDLISEGNLGLIKAIDKFDENKGVKFISYAVWWIRQSIQESIKRKQQQTINELIEDNNVSHDSEENNNILENEKLFVHYSDDPQIGEVNKHGLLMELINKLDKRAQFILMAYFGLDGESMTLEEIGKILHLSKERVRKIKEKNLRILRSEILISKKYSDLM